MAGTLISLSGGSSPFRLALLWGFILFFTLEHIPLCPVSVCQASRVSWSGGCGLAAGTAQAPVTRTRAPGVPCGPPLPCSCHFCAGPAPSPEQQSPGGSAGPRHGRVEPPLEVACQPGWIRRVRSAGEALARQAVLAGQMQGVRTCAPSTGPAKPK